METPFDIFCFVLFILEGFLSLAHAHIALSFRALPLKDMARLQYFFLFATLTIATTSQVVVTQFWMADTFVMAHHLYCYVTWNSSSYTKKIIHWSSLNWTGSRMKVLPLFIGSLGLVLLHGHHAYLLGELLHINLIILGLVGVHCAVMAVMYNKQLAWAAPSNVPEWITKRVEDSKSILSSNVKEDNTSSSTSSRSKKAMKHN
ncbi:uncharacterized protein LOC124352537 [Daphnia pulicaria]|uniref:uncharacterized protein LOC124352537 n=1 Tax=Daphnia pulicaria TaxID=35523 RepID=UPI001EEAB352|nr:uncharacterized protein LOC124352537 [Daphnia pulicaria]